MSDNATLVKRLRLQQNNARTGDLCCEAAARIAELEAERDKLTKELAFLKPLTVKPDDTDGYLVERKAYRELEAELDKYKRLWLETRGK